MPLGLRTLQQDAQAVAPAEITIVSTPKGFVDAVQRGALDIVITEHLDLTTVDLQPTSICEVGCESPLGEIFATRSIRVRIRRINDFPGYFPCSFQT